MTFGSLFNFEGPHEFAGGKLEEPLGEGMGHLVKRIWGCSSAGRAPALQAGGHRFEPVHLHHTCGGQFGKGTRRKKNAGGPTEG